MIAIISMVAIVVIGVILILKASAFCWRTIYIEYDDAPDKFCLWSKGRLIGMYKDLESLKNSYRNDLDSCERRKKQILERKRESRKFKKEVRKLNKELRKL